MLHSRLSAVDKRRRLRQRIANGALTVMPGAYSPLIGRMIEQHGFDGVYVSGHMLAASLGLPDIGLTTSVEVAMAAAFIARTTDLPVIIDADTGFGSPASVGRTIQLLEDAGVAGCHIEDQAEPKRVGGAGVRLVNDEIAARRITAAVAARRDPDFLIIARTDARPVEGFSRALERARRYRNAGADVIFVEGVQEASEIAAMMEAGVAPVLVNVNELAGNRLTRAELQALGVAIAIHPMALMRIALTSTDRALSQLALEGTMTALADEMYTPEALALLLDAAGYPADDA